ncbi:TRAP transporter small permease subunit [Chloroflexota bacterium]
MKLIWLATKNVAKIVVAGRIVGAVAVIVMAITILVDVTGRFLFSHPIPGTMELNEELMVVAAYLAFAAAQAADMHPGVELFVIRLSTRKRELLSLATLFVSLVFFSFITFNTSVRALASWADRESRQGLIAFPIWPARIFLALGCFLLCMQFTVDILAGLRRLGILEGEPRHGGKP